MSKSSAIGHDLLALETALRKHAVCSDPYPLNAAGQYCISTSQKPNWNYSLGKITFTADLASKRMPFKCTDINVSLYLAISGAQTDTNDTSDPINTLEFNIEIEGKIIRPGQTSPDDLLSAWHLDRHIVGGSTPGYCHPLYHLAFGGYKMEPWELEYGRTIIMPAPRILYPPMDAILGVDFILQNYKDKSTIKNILEDSNYRRIVANSQERLWKPFFESIHSHWSPTGLTIHKDFAPKVLLPFCI